MSAVDVQAKVRSGLAKAKAAVGEADSPIVYLTVITGGGGNDPFNQTPLITVNTELPNAVFKNIARGTMNNSSLIKEGDRELVCDGDNEIKQNAIITQGAKEFIVVDIIVSEPFGYPISYRPIVRLK
jgi:hypothetical protein